MSLNENGKAYLITHANEFMKEFLVYDGSDRVISIYSAHTNAAHGDSCILTTYEYVTGTIRIEKKKDALSTWDSSYEI